jgi:hypothetical protein
MKTQTIDMVKVQNLVNEYKADPNCWPELWISGENVTDDEKKLFIELALK